ncbi:CBS domain-containing protein [Chitinophaga rhizosphaerae]|uniref:CBS domain-containing protein n=1 Tax=Chitinophaga rhizosphaerae TaxID=1864947 RepID=UPI000F8153EB|nr:CBS domain-containing protein [Chitinophaga rhizosphaerae]
MLVQELISPVVPVLLPQDTGAKALRLMNEFHLTHLPLVVDNKYTYLVEEDQVLDWEDPDQLLETVPPGPLRPAVPEGAHFYEALKVFYDFKLSALPVISREGEYLGVITRENLLAALAMYNGVKEPGGVVVLEMEPRDYSLSEIARIAESNEVSLLSVNTLTNPATAKLEVVLKTNRQEMQGLIATFERFNYTIKYMFSEEQEEDLLKKNYDLLMNYISM